MKMRVFSSLLTILLACTHLLSEPQAGRQQSQQTLTSLVDLDQNGISDGLDEVLSQARPQDRFSVIVTFQRPYQMTALERSVGRISLKRTFNLVKGFAADMTVAQIRGLSRTPGIFRIEQDFLVHAVLDAANLDFGTALARTDFGVSGYGVTICVVDTGVDPNHESLDSKTLVFHDEINGLVDPYDDHFHGTHVASICCGDGVGSLDALTYQGVAPGADVYAAKVLNSNGSGTAAQVIGGIEWCAAQGAVDIVSMSLGSSTGSDGLDSISQAVNAAVDAGKIVVIAAGNSGAAPQTVGSPGAAEKALTVGAVAEWSSPSEAENHSNGVYLAPFSSRGPTLANLVKPEVVAPGVSIMAADASTVDQYVPYSGTSMATPFVSGAVALAIENSAGLTPADVKSLVQYTAIDRGPPGIDPDWGAGLLDGYALVASSAGLSDYTPTVFPPYQRVSGSVPDSGVWQYEFTLSEDDLDVPIGASLVIDGELGCSLGIPSFCLVWEWSPDLDARLLDPLGNELVLSGCPGIGSQCGNVGRVEGLSAMPTVAGVYRIEVWPFADAPNNGLGGSFTLELSSAPVDDGGGSPPPNDPPSVDVFYPQDSSEVSGVEIVQVTASDEDAEGTLNVEIRIGGGVWNAAAYDNGYYVWSWDTTGESNGLTTVSARATDIQGAQSSVSTVSVTVNNPEPPQDLISVKDPLQTGFYETTGKGRNKSTQFVEITDFSLGDQVVIRAVVLLDGSPIQNAVVSFSVTGQESAQLTSSLSDENGIAEAIWQTRAPNKREKGGTAAGSYMATVTDVLLEGYVWDETPASKTFSLE